MILSKLKENLKKTKENLNIKLSNIFANKKDIEEILEQLEETLILSDVGAMTSAKICDEVREGLKLQQDKSEEAIKNLIKKSMVDILNSSNSSDEKDDTPSREVLLIVGVNGVGKTTSIGKITNLYKKQGKKVLLCAADTFRAGAIEQLDIWAKRNDVDIVLGAEGQDPSSVIYEATKKFSQDKSYDILICDTAGRLHNKVNLMAELEKMNRIIDKNSKDTNKKIYMVLDATTGTNGAVQAKSFYDKISLDGIILTKLDSTSKGGIVFTIISELKIPIKYIGTGEQIDDIEEFSPTSFVDSII